MRKYRNLHCKELESHCKRDTESIPEITELSPKKRGCPLLLGYYDGRIQEYMYMFYGTLEV